MPTSESVQANPPILVPVEGPNCAGLLVFSVHRIAFQLERGCPVLWNLYSLRGEECSNVILLPEVINYCTLYNLTVVGFLIAGSLYSPLCLVLVIGPCALL